MENRPSLIACLKAWAVLTPLGISWSELDLTVQKWNGQSTEGGVGSSEQGRNMLGLGIGVLVLLEIQAEMRDYNLSQAMLLWEGAPEEICCVVLSRRYRGVEEAPPPGASSAYLQSRACPHWFLLNWAKTSQICLLWNNALLQLVLWCASLSGSALLASKHLLKSEISSYSIIPGIPFQWSRRHPTNRIPLSPLWLQVLQNAPNEILVVASSTLCNLLLEFSPSKEVST